jgi:hypothetical protein
MRRREFLGRASAVAGGLSGSVAVLPPALAGSPAYLPSAVIAWNGAVTAAIAASASGPTVAARALAMVYEAIYNAWAAYVKGADFTLPGLRKLPKEANRTSNKTIAISHAAHAALVDLFPLQAPLFDQTLAQLLSRLPTSAPDALAAAQNGLLAGATLVQARFADGSNQHGELAPGAYADYTGYRPVNDPYLPLVDPLRWQPLVVTNAAGVTAAQKCLTPHWGRVRPFALSSGAALRPRFEPFGPSLAEIEELVRFSAALNDETKVQVDFWANNPGSVTPPGQWCQFAATVAAIDGNSLDQDVLLFFTLGQALLDASIAAWECKVAYDSARPITLLRHFYAGQQISAWAGPGLGTQLMDGSVWRPYQRSTNPTPNFQEFVSGHSTFSAAAAQVIAAWRGDDVTLAFDFPAGGVGLEPSVPAVAMRLSWPSLSSAAAAAGLSRRYGGIHFEQADLKGRALGKAVGQAVLRRGAALYGSVPGGGTGKG